MKTFQDITENQISQNNNMKNLINQQKQLQNDVQALSLRTMDKEICRDRSKGDKLITAYYDDTISQGV